MKQKYIPIDHDFIEIFQKEAQKERSKVVFFLDKDEPELSDSKGKILKIDTIKGEGEFLFFDNDDKVRLDRVVVINGKPGPAYDEYDSYGLAPLTCQAGYSDCAL